MRGARARVRELSDRYGLAVDPDAVIEDITVGTQQRVEILQTLYRGARILVLDEPTAVLTAQETKELFEHASRSLKKDGLSIVFISHKLNEVLEIADRVTVLRRGKKVDTVPTEGATEQSLARLMVGRDVLLRVEKASAKPASRCSRSRTCTCATTAACGGAGVSLDGARRRDRRARRRGRQRPARAGRGDRRPARSPTPADPRRRART